MLCLERPTLDNMARYSRIDIVMFPSLRKKNHSINFKANQNLQFCAEIKI